MYREIFNRLPENYSGLGQINNEKFHEIVFSQHEELRRVFEDIKDSKDIDKAKGQSLDNIGKNVQEYRYPNDKDDNFRKWVKIKILANRSDGSMPIINRILKAYMEDDFIGIEEGWKAYVKEPASLVVNIHSRIKEIPFEVLQRIKAGGVKAYFTLGLESSKIIVNFRSHEFPVPYKITNMFHTADVEGGLAKSRIELVEKGYSFDVNYPITNTFTTVGTIRSDVNLNINLASDYKDNKVLFKRVSKFNIGEGDI